MPFDKLIRGALLFRRTLRPNMLDQFEKIRDQPEPKAVMFTCIDSRVLITRVLQTDVGDMLLVRNAGNFVPHAKLFGTNSVSTEAGALELGCIINDIKHIAVCGHSDCKAMNALYGIRDKLDLETDSPLKMWIKRHGAATVTKFEKFEVHGHEEPLEFTIEHPKKAFKAYIDPENRFNITDKFSQVNTLQQLKNISSYSFLHERLDSGETKMIAMWFDVYRGDFYMFSYEQQRFVVIDEDSYEDLIEEAENRKDNK